LSESESVQISLWFVYICIAVEDPIIKREGLGSHFQVSRRQCVGLIQARTCISNVICRVFVSCSVGLDEKWLFLLLILMKLLTITF